MRCSFFELVTLKLALVRKQPKLCPLDIQQIIKRGFELNRSECLENNKQRMQDKEFEINKDVI